MDRLEASLREAPVIEKDGYNYFVHPISDGVPRVDPALLREVVVGVIRAADLDGVDKIVTPAAMGIHISTAVSLAVDVPVVVIRKRQYGLDGEVSLAKRTGYSESEMFLNDVDEGDRVLVVDDVLSTGGTLGAITQALDDIGAEITDVVVVIGKVGDDGTLADVGYDVETLVDVDVVDGEVVIVDDPEA